MSTSRTSSSETRRPSSSETGGNTLKCMPAPTTRSETSRTISALAFGDGQDHGLHAMLGGDLEHSCPWTQHRHPEQPEVPFGPRASSMKPTTLYGDSGSVLISRMSW